MKKFVLFLICAIFSAAIAVDANAPQQTPDRQEPNISPQEKALHEQMEQRRRLDDEARQEASKRRGEAERQAIGLKSNQQQLAEEYHKHNYRVAVLERIRQLAQETGQNDKIAKVDELMKLENDRHAKKITKLHSVPGTSGNQ